jgi:hypothetical protein
MTAAGGAAAGVARATGGGGAELGADGAGIGCRGPDRICPGLGAGGTGLAGIGALRG